MSVIGHLGGNIQNEGIEKIVEPEEAEKKVRKDGEALPGGLKRAGDTGEVYEKVEDYDPVLRWHCRL